MYANALGEINSHISLLMDAAVYDNADTTAYAKPADPGPFAQHGPGNSVVV